MRNHSETSASVITIGLMWHSTSSDNLGVGALTLGQIEICRESATKAGVELRFLIFGTKGRLQYGPADATVQNGSRISIKQIIAGRSPFVREVGGCDLVLDIGEGDSFTDIYGLKRYLFLLLSKVVVLVKRVPLVLSPQTIGPFDRWYTRILAAAVMRRCDRIFARDGLSFDYLKRCNVASKTVEVMDVAFRLPYEKQTHGDRQRIHVGLNVSGLLFSGGYSGTNQFGLSLDYPAFIRQLISEWSANPAIEVWLVPHVVSDDFPRDDDRMAITTLLAEFPAVRRAPNFTNPIQAKSFISGLDFLTGARMHACIAALSAGVPVVPFAYSRKFNGLFSSLGYYRIADGKRHSSEEALSVIREGLQDLEQLKIEVDRAKRTAGGRLALYGDYLEQKFRTIRAARGKF